VFPDKLVIEQADAGRHAVHRKDRCFCEPFRQTIACDFRIRDRCIYQIK
jgi:hypothetical protein